MRAICVIPKADFNYGVSLHNDFFTPSNKVSSRYPFQYAQVHCFWDMNQTCDVESIAVLPDCHTWI